MISIYVFITISIVFLSILFLSIIYIISTEMKCVKKLVKKLKAIIDPSGWFKRKPKK